MIRIDLIAKQISDAVFRGGDVPDGCERYETRSGLRGMKVGGEVTLIEQNPNTGSRFAELARGGAEILWAFFDNAYWRTAEGTKGIINGEWRKDMHSV